MLYERTEIENLTHVNVITDWSLDILEQRFWSSISVKARETSQNSCQWRLDSFRYGCKPALGVWEGREEFPFYTLYFFHLQGNLLKKLIFQDRIGPSNHCFTSYKIQYTRVYIYIYKHTYILILVYMCVCVCALHGSKRTVSLFVISIRVVNLHICRRNIRDVFQ